MGATAADTQREIEEIRKDVSSAVDELRRRVTRTADVRTQARLQTRRAKDNPAALAAAGLGVAGLGGVAAYRAVSEARRRRRPEERFKRSVRSAAEELGGRLERAREALPFDIHLAGGDDDKDDKRGSNVDIEMKEPSMIKRILWGALVAAVMAGAGLAGRRLSAAVWRAAMKEEPPTASV